MSKTRISVIMTLTFPGLCYRLAVKHPVFSVLLCFVFFYMLQYIIIMIIIILMSKDNLTCSREELGITPWTPGFVDNYSTIRTTANITIIIVVIIIIIIIITFFICLGNICSEFEDTAAMSTCSLTYLTQ